MNELPSITSSGYVSNNMVDAGMVLGNVAQLGLVQHPLNRNAFDEILAKSQVHPQAAQAQPKKEVQVSTARIVKVYIADPNENLSLSDRVLYSGDEQLTDSTDQELFFETPIKELLAKHNELRLHTIDKKASEKSGRDVLLEAVRIRDLKMVVVTVASFA